jgi:hypothetical protein
MSEFSLQMVQQRKRFYGISLDSLIGSNLKQEIEEELKESIEKVQRAGQMRVEARIREIEALLTSQILTTQCQQKLTIELLFLQCLPHYKELKDDIFSNFWGYLEQHGQNLPEKYYFDRSFYSRDKPPRRLEVCRGVTSSRRSRKTSSSSRSETGES